LSRPFIVFMKTGDKNVQRVVILHLKGHVYLYMGIQELKLCT